MILLHRLNGVGFALNPDLVQRAEQTPDTILTLTDGTHIVVCESVAEISELMVTFRASVLAQAWEIRAPSPDGPGLRIVQDPIN